MNEKSVSNEHDAEPNGVPRRAGKRRPMYIALGIIGVVAAAAAVFLFVRFGGGGGQPVPAPRTVGFDQTTSDQPDGAAGVEQIVKIQPDQIDKLGLKIEAVGETLSSEASAASATGVVQPNAYTETPVISLVGGALRSAPAVLGEYVAKGSAVAVISSDEFAAAQGRYLSLQTEVRTARQNYDRLAKLLKISPVSQTELDQARADLTAKQAALDETRRRYDRTVRLVEIGASSREELDQDRTRLKSAEADAVRAGRQFQRSTEVARLAPASNAEFEQAAVRLRTAESDLAAAAERLIVLGMSPSAVNNFRSPSQITSELVLTAPVSGTVTARSVNQGEIVEANKELLRVTNLSTVWVIAQVYESDLARLKAGTGASVTSNAYPDKLFRGRVTYIDPNINQQTRTAQVRVELANPGESLKIGMYVNVAFGSTGMAERTMPVVPAAAVQNLNNKQIVFVASDSPGVFAVRRLRLGSESDGRFVVLDGLNVGERVVTDGSFMLRAEAVRQGNVN